MAFLRDYFQQKSQNPAEEEKLRLLQPVKLGGAGAGPSKPTVFTPTQAQANVGARAPLLADYLRANVGSAMGQKAMADVAKQAGELEGKTWQGTARGVQEKPTNMSLAGTALAAPPTAPKAKPLAPGVKRSEGLQGTPQKGVSSLTLETQPLSTQDLALARTQGATATLAQPKAGVSELQRYLEATRNGATATLNQGTAISPVMSAQEAAKKAEQIEQEAAQLGTQAGRQAYLQEKYGKGQQYSTGEAMLDAALMGGLSGSQLSGLNKKYEQLYETITGKQQAAQKSYEDEQAALQALKDAEPKLGPGEERTTTMVDPEQVRKDQAFLKAQQYRKEDAPLEEKRGKGKGPWTLSREQLANRAGMTLEEWILAGEPEL